jgi:hypothetical protein
MLGWRVCALSSLFLGEKALVANPPLNKFVRMTSFHSTLPGRIPSCYSRNRRPSHTFSDYFAIMKPYRLKYTSSETLIFEALA